MPLTDAQKRAMQKYVQNVLAGLDAEMGSPEHQRAVHFMEKRREYARRASKKMYDGNPDSRDRKLNRTKEAYYYNNDDNKFLLAVRRLFITA